MEHYRDKVKDLPLPLLVALEEEHRHLLETLPDDYREEAELSLIAIRSHIELKTRLRHGTPED